MEIGTNEKRGNLALPAVLYFIALAVIFLIDEISGGNMRAYRDGKYIEPLQLEKLILA